MRLTTFLRIMWTSWKGSSLREKYWTLSEVLTKLKRLCGSGNRGFRKLVIRSSTDFVLSRPNPATEETRARIDAAARWLALCQDATPDDGASLGYFPLNSDSTAGWRPSYPETTGYIMQSLIEYAERYGRDEMRERAMRMGVWETEIQMANGAVQGGTVCAPENQVAAVFNTGMVLQGYTAALMAGAGEPIATSARRAAEFLVSDIGDDGHLRSHGAFVTEDRIKTYNVLCAWALQRYGTVMGEHRYANAAVRLAEAAVGQQDSGGWFADDCLTDSRRPLTHTIGYTLQGLLETGVGVDRRDFVDAVVRDIEPLMHRVSPIGFLHGRYFQDWEAASFACCLTGSAQLSLVAYRLFELTGAQRYSDFADKLLNFLKPLQELRSPNPALNGCLAGSFPILGGYMTGGYPNWATKYFLDALTLQDRLSDSR